jgi:REP element-mobilizing transposase RayT
MPQSLAHLYVHLIFSTKARVPYLKDRLIRGKLHAYLFGICEHQSSPALKIGGVEDHVHLLCRLSKQGDVSSLIRELKRDSSKWIKEQSLSLPDFHWQAGYAAFSISPAHKDALIDYIANQEEHHKQESFQDELRRVCRKYGIEVDERYAWD